MKKSVKTITMLSILLLVVYVFSTQASAVLVGKNGFYYDFEGEQAILKQYHGSNTEVVIPTSIYSYNISEIGDYAFLRNTDITSVFIPDTITKIGNCAFYGCTNLEVVYVPESVTFIGDSAFTKCDNVTILCHPDSVGEAYAQENSIKCQVISFPKDDGYILPSPESVVPMMGDVDGNGLITTVDSLLVLRNSVSIENFNEIQSVAADVDADGLITVSDSLYILRYCVGYVDDGVNIGSVIE